jgi:hypothetical protein
MLNSKTATSTKNVHYFRGTVAFGSRFTQSFKINSLDRVDGYHGYRKQNKTATASGVAVIAVLPIGTARRLP